MHLILFAQSLSETAAAITMDESTVSVLAMLVGIVAGFTITGLRTQPKSKKVKVDRKAPPRDVD